MSVHFPPKTQNPKPRTGSKPLAVVLASGGLDSCVAAAVARLDYNLALFHANYAQRTLMRELSAFRAQAAFYQVASTLEVDLNYLGEIGGSCLTDLDQAVPTGESEPPGIPSTYVPFRNTNLMAAAVAWAEVLGAEAVFIGANVLDNPGYPDCRPEFIQAFTQMANLATKAGVEGQTRIRIHTPLISLSKAEIIRLGLDLGVDHGLTHSCYDPSPDGRPCGACDSCLLRRKGFADAGLADPLPYPPD